MLRQAHRSGGLLERGEELGALADALDEAAAGHGSPVVISGPAGIGKTRLVGAAADLARQRGLPVLAARGGELERSFPYGCVRQLFEREARDHGALTGAAALAGPALGGPVSAPGSAVHDAFAIHHGLDWLTVDIATAASGLVLSIDDAHWCDRPTLDWVRYLVRRLDDVPAMVVLASRSGEPSGELDFLDALTVDASALVLRPAPLTAGGVRTFVTEALGATDDEAVGACVDAMGGNPFLLGQLVAAALHRDGRNRRRWLQRPARPRPKRSCARSSCACASGSDAVELAQSVAVLGVAAQARHAASLAGLSERRAAVAQDVLVAADALTDTAPRAFVHPLVRRAVDEAIPGAERSLLHARAARVLRQAGIPAELVAGELLACSPAGNSWTVETLRWCAAAVVARTPDAAVHYLERALREPPEPGRARRRWQPSAKSGAGERRARGGRAPAYGRGRHAIRPGSAAPRRSTSHGRWRLAAEWPRQ